MKYRVLTGGLFILGMCLVSAPSTAQAGGITDIGQPLGKVWRCTSDPRELLTSNCLRSKKEKTKPVYNPSAYSQRLQAYEQRKGRVNVKLQKPQRTIKDKRVK